MGRRLSRRGRLSATLVAGSLGAVALAQTAESLRLEPEFDVASPVLSGASGEQTVPRAAWDGGQFLVTWRSSFWKDELRATRLSASGQVMDGRGLRVAGRMRNDGSAPVASGGGGFLIAYVEDPAKVMVVRASGGAGELTLAPPALLFGGGDDFSTSEPAVSFANPGFWVLWARQSPTPVVVAARVHGDGRPQDATPIELGRGFGAVAAASEGTSTWAVWSVADQTASPEKIELRLAQLDASAGTASPAGGKLLLASAGRSVSQVTVAVGGGQRMAAAAIAGADGAHSIVLTRFSPGGDPLDAGRAPLPAGGRIRGGPSAAWNGQAFVLTWSVEGTVGGRPSPQLRSATIDASGNVADLAPPAASRAGQHPQVVAGGSDGPLMLFWEEVIRLSGAGDAANTDVQAQPFPNPVNPKTATVVSLAPSWHSEPVVAWNGRRALVAFEDGREDTAQIDVYAARVDGEGKGLDGGGIPLGVGPGVQHAPVVAWDGRNFVVAWNEADAGLALVRITEEGQVLDRPAQRVPGTAGVALLSEPAICGTSKGTLLAWGARATPAAQAELRVLELPPGQAQDVIGPSTVLAQTADDVQAPVLRLGCMSQAALLVWSGKLASAPEQPSSLNYLRFALDGPMSAPPAITTLAPRITEEWSGIAHNGDGQVFLASWRSFNERGQRTVYAARIDASGRLLDPLPGIAVGNSNSGRRVTTLWDGRQWVVMAVHTQGGNPFELRARRLSPGGEVLDPNWVLVSVLSKPWGGGGAGAEGVVVAPGRALLVYEQYPEDDASSNPRARARFIETPVRGPDYVPPDSGAWEDGGAPEAGTPSTGGAARATGGGCDCALGTRRAPAAGVLVATPLLVALALGRLRRRRSR